MTLTGGGTLCIAPKQDLLNDLGQVAAAFDITYMPITPSGMNTLPDTSSLRYTQYMHFYSQLRP